MSFENNCDPIPTQVAPARNHAPRLSRVGSTPPVIIKTRSGTTGIIDLTNSGPKTEPGNILITPAPFSFAVTASVNVAQPGIQSLSLFLQTSAISSLRIGEI